MMKRFALVAALCLASSAQAEDAAQVWSAKCKSCHGEDGKAKTKVGEKESIVDLTQPAWQKAQTDTDIREMISEGSPRNKKMRPYKEKLTPQQIDGLVGYIRTLKGK